jgi:arylsulfatase
MKKPNLLLIMCDQLRPDALGCYGNAYVKTPNIDRLAEKGVCFTQAYSTTPVCVPARNGLIAGQHPFELGLLDNAPLIKPIENPLPELIRRQGYSTSAIGKMHFEPVRNHYGFDRMHLSEEIPRHAADDDYLQHLREKGYEHVFEPHGKRSENYYVPQISELPEELHTSAWTADMTCETIRRNRNRPFFIFSSFIKPHPPFDPCEPYDSMYSPEDVPMPMRKEEERHPDDWSIWVQNDYKVNGADSISDEQLRRIRAAYYGCVTQLDKQVGKIMDTLEECGLADNTLIIFTSDHGEMLGDHYAFGKRTFYEQSIRIPLIMSWAGRIPQKEKREQFAILQDIYSTLITAAGGVVPASSCGLDLLSVAKDENRKHREKVYGEFGQGRALKFMLREGAFKYIYHTHGGKENLFNLENDPDELSNIALDYPEMCKNFKADLTNYYHSYGLDEAFEDGELKKYEEQDYVPQGYLNQYPKWPGTIKICGTV